MVTVKFYGMLKLTVGVNELKVEGKTINELIENIAKETFKSREKELVNELVKELRNSLIFVNEVSFLSLNKYKTKLYKDDLVAFLSPASGG